jgi:hypothetical protein
MVTVNTIAMNKGRNFFYESYQSILGDLLNVCLLDIAMGMPLWTDCFGNPEKSFFLTNRE